MRVFISVTDSFLGRVFFGGLGEGLLAGFVGVKIFVSLAQSSHFVPRPFIFSIASGPLFPESPLKRFKSLFNHLDGIVSASLSLVLLVINTLELQTDC